MDLVNRISGLYAIVDSSQAALMPLHQLAEEILQGGGRILQLRMKQATADEVRALARKIAALKARFDFLFIVNDHPELAAELDADGVHLGQEDSSVDNARRLLGPEKLIGKSNHSLDEVESTLAEDVDYIALGAIFPTSGKGPGHPIVGTALLKQVVNLSPVPVVAIGGINRLNIQEVLKTGVASVAMISGLTQTGDVVKETAFYVSCFGENT